MALESLALKKNSSVFQTLMSLDWMRLGFTSLGLFLCIATSGCLTSIGVSLSKRAISYAALHDPSQAGVCGDLEGQRLVACQAELAYEHPEIKLAREEFAAYLESDSLSDGWPDLCSAAGRGHPDAQLIMARAYRNGWKPANRSDGKAYQWYLRASANGHPVATAELQRLKDLMAPAIVEVQRQKTYTWEPDPDDCPPRAIASTGEPIGE